MSKSVSLKDIKPFIDEMLTLGKSISFMPNGQSMLPLIREGKDSAVIGPVPKKLKKYDIIFYKRSDGQYVLHRIVKVLKDSYVLCGDNQIKYEYGVTDDMIFGFCTAIIRDGVTITPDNKKYRRYLKKLYFIRPVKRIYTLAVRIFSKIKSKMHIF